MTPTLATGIETALMICFSVSLLGPVFYWLLTDGRPTPISPTKLT